MVRSSAFSVVVSVVITGIVIANLFLAPRSEQLFFTDAEFSPAHQLQTERAQWYLQWGYIWFPEKVDAIHFLCVAEDSPHFAILQGPWNLRGTKVITDCEPLDLSDRLADQLHPNLITEDIRRSQTFFAYDPNYSPKGNWAILVRAQYDTYVMVHTDTLRHLGLADIEVPE